MWINSFDCCMSGAVKIDFETEDWESVRSKVVKLPLDASDRQFLLDTLGHWQAGDFYLDLTTSGSTGKPKPVRLNRELLEWSNRASAARLGIQGKQHLLCCLPVQKAGGAMQLVRAYLNKWEITIIPPSANPFISIGEDHMVTVVSITPFQLGRILEQGHSTKVLSGFDIVLIGGGMMAHGDFERLNALPGSTRFIQTYGMTETAGHVALADIRDKGVFSPLEGALIKADPQGNARITIGGMEFSTTDRIEEVTGGFRVLGRSDFVINSGGLKIQPEELEKRILSATNTQEIPAFFFYGLPDPELGQRLVLIIEGDTNPSLESRVNELLSGVERPHNFIYMGEFAYTSNGKLDRRGTVALLR